jgi:hypothetical protein
MRRVGLVTVVVTMLVLLLGAGTAGATWSIVGVDPDTGAGQVHTIALVILAIGLAAVVVGPFLFIRSRVRRHRSTN